jgi:hypothetical protein
MVMIDQLNQKEDGANSSKGYRYAHLPDADTRNTSDTTHRGAHRQAGSAKRFNQKNSLQLCCGVAVFVISMTV